MQDAANASQVQAIGSQSTDLGQFLDVPAGVPACPTRAAGRVQQALPLVDPQRLRVQPGQLGGNRDAEQAPVQVRPPRTHHGHSRSRARYRSTSLAMTASLISSSSQPPAAAAEYGPSTRTGPARSGGPKARAIGVMAPSPPGSAARR